MKKHITQIKRARIFKGIPAADFDSMLEQLDSQLKSYRRTQVLFPEGAHLRRVGLLLEGEVEIQRHTWWNKTSVLFTVHPGQLFGINFACAPGSITNVSCKAISNSVVLWFNMHEILQLDGSSPFHTVLIRNLMNELALSNLVLFSKVNHTSAHSTREKLLSYLSEEALLHKSDEFDIEMDRQELADYLGVERSAMSSQLSALVKEGYLTTNKNHFRLLNPKAKDQSED